jgi:hypothetical protein
MGDLHLINTQLLSVYTLCSESPIIFESIAAGAQDTCSFVFLIANLSKWKVTTDCI